MITQIIATNKWGPILEILIITLNWILILFLSIGIILMTLLIFKPETVGKLTSLSDKWISTRAMTKPLEVLYFHFDEFVLAHNTIFGIIMILFSFIIVYLLY